MENEKVFKKEGEFLIVTVTNEDKLILPNKQNDNGKEEIGTFEQTTIQKIGLAKAPFLQGFISEQREQADSQIKALDKKLEELKDITEIDPEVVKAVQITIGKGSKVFKQKMLVLNDHISKVAEKQRIVTQKEFMQKELDKIVSDFNGINKALE